MAIIETPLWAGAPYCSFRPSAIFSPRLFEKDPSSPEAKSASGPAAEPSVSFMEYAMCAGAVASGCGAAAPGVEGISMKVFLTFIIPRDVRAGDASHRSSRCSCATA